MNGQQIFVILSALVVGCQSEQGTCGSTDQPKKVPETVASHLKSIVRSIWKEELLRDQTLEVKEFLSDHLVERDVKIEEELSKKAEKISSIEGDLSKKAEQISSIQGEMSNKAEKISSIEGDLSKKYEKITSIEKELARKDQQISELIQSIKKLTNDQQVKI